MEAEDCHLNFYLTFQNIPYFGFIMFFRDGKKMENTYGGIDHDCLQACTSHFAWLYFCDISLQDCVEYSAKKSLQRKLLEKIPFRQFTQSEDITSLRRLAISWTGAPRAQFRYQNKVSNVILDCLDVPGPLPLLQDRTGLLQIPSRSSQPSLDVLYSPGHGRQREMPLHHQLTEAP